MKKGKAGLIVLVLVIAVFGALTGCGTKSSGSNASSSGNAPASSASSSSDSSGKSGASTAKSSPKVTLNFATNYVGDSPNTAAMNEAIKEMKAQDPNVTINLEGAPGDQLKTKMKVLVASGKTPDLFTYWIGSSYEVPFIKADLLLPVDDFFKEAKKVSKDNWDPTMWTTTKVDGQDYSFPLTTSRSYFLYNKSIFDKYNLKPPTNWVELKNVASVLNSHGIIPIAEGSKDSNPGHWFYTAVVAQYDNGISDSNNITTTYKIDTPAFNKGAQMISEMQKLKMFPADTVANGDWGPMTALYTSGKAAMIYTDPWEISTISKSAVGPVSKVMNVPMMDGATVDSSTFTVGSAQDALYINKKSWSDNAKRQAILDFAQILLSDNVAQELAKGGNLPAKKVDVKYDDPLANQVYPFIAKAQEVPFTKAELPDAAVTQTYNQLIDQLYAGQVSPDQFIKQMQSALDKSKSSQ